jgi:hypothetical protein
MQSHKVYQTENRYISQLDAGNTLSRDEDYFAAVRMAQAAREKAQLKLFLRRARAGLVAGAVAK